MNGSLALQLKQREAKYLLMERERTKALSDRVFHGAGFLPPGSLFSTAEARPSNSSSSPKPDVDPPPSKKNAGGAVQQAEGLLVIARRSAGFATFCDDFLRLSNLG